MLVVTTCHNVLLITAFYIILPLSRVSLWVSLGIEIVMRCSSTWTVWCSSFHTKFPIPKLRNGHAKTASAYITPSLMSTDVTLARYFGRNKLGKVVKFQTSLISFPEGTHSTIQTIKIRKEVETCKIDFKNPPHAPRISSTIFQSRVSFKRSLNWNHIFRVYGTCLLLSLQSGCANCLSEIPAHNGMP